MSRANGQRESHCLRFSGRRQRLPYRAFLICIAATSFLTIANPIGTGRNQPPLRFIQATSLSASSFPSDEIGIYGGSLVTSQSAGPQTFNPLLAYDQQTLTVSDCMMGHLIRINRRTQQAEPELARSWRISEDGQILTFNLRPGVKFSDGHPFTADDVVFTFQVLTAPEIDSPVSDLFTFSGKKVTAEKIDDYTVRFAFPSVHAAVERLFDAAPILPKHALEQPYRAGKFQQAWNLGTPPEEIPTPGPFKLKAYIPGQRTILTRNANYWKADATGNRLPYLNEIVFDIDPDKNTRLLKFQKGQTDLLSPVSVEDLHSLSELENNGKIKAVSLGPSLIREILWFNLNERINPNTQKPVVDPAKLHWFKEVKFRQAISHAIDRDAIVRLVFFGKASPLWAFTSSGNKVWFNPHIKQYPYDLDQAKRLLLHAGFRYGAEPGKSLLDPEGNPVEFTLCTNAGNVLRQKMSAIIQEDLARIGIKVGLSFLESKALLAKINASYDYEACLLAIVSGDTDPTSEKNFLLSNGANHWWYPKQLTPATPWEARIDELMNRQAISLDLNERKRLFDEVQVTLSEQLPFIFLVSRHLIVAAKSRIGNLEPAHLPDFVLWNCDRLYFKP